MQPGPGKELTMDEEMDDGMARLLDELEGAAAVHVYPVDDVRQHELAGDSCWCEPEVEYPNLTLDPEQGAWVATGYVVIHRASITLGEVPEGWPPG
jgi:hypothetical protein